MRRSTPSFATPDLGFQHIVLCIPANLGSRRQVVRGIARFARTLPRWNLVYEPDIASVLELQSRVRSAHGLICTPPTSEPELALCATFNKPLVIIGDDLPPFHCVTADEHAIGQRAADFFRVLGLRDVAFVGFPQAPFSDQRLRGLTQAAQAGGLSVHTYPSVIYAAMDQDPHEFEPFRRWLDSLPRPTGVMAVTATVGRVFVELCRELSVRVPEDLLVLGVDDDPFVCELSHPALSTIDQAAEQIGFRAAQLLDQLMHGQHADQRQSIRISPRDVIVRQSTLPISADIPEVLQAVRFIQQSLSRTIRVDDVVEHVAMSRRALERAFKRNLDRSIHDEIIRQRIDLARQLLIQSDLSVQEISDRCGFSYLSKFSKTFRDQTQQTPTQFRKASRR